MTQRWCRPSQGQNPQPTLNGISMGGNYSSVELNHKQFFSSSNIYYKQSNINQTKIEFDFLTSAKFAGCLPRAKQNQWEGEQEWKSCKWYADQFQS